MPIRPARLRLAGTAALALFTAALPSCGYSARVRNASQKTVVAEIRHDRFLADTSSRDARRLEPGDETSMGPFRIDPLEPIYLRISIEGDVFGGWQEERLEMGGNSFIIEDGTLESWEAVSIRRE